MKEFLYRAIDDQGRRIHGEVQALDQQKAVTLLQKNRLTVLELLPLTRKSFSSYFFAPVKGQMLAMYIRHLGTMLKAGIPLAEALRSLIPETGPAPYRKALQRLSEDVESGFYLSQAMRRAPDYFNSFMIGSVRIGEASGTLDLALSQCADYYEREWNYSRRLRSALLYPTVLFGASGLLVFFIFTFMIPRFVGLFVDLQVELPWATNLLVESAYFVETYGLIAFFTLLGPGVCLGYLVYRWLQTGSGMMRFDRLLLRLPWYGRQVRYRMLGQYFRAMSTLSRSGVTLEASLRLLQVSLDREILKRTVAHQLRDVRKGRPFTESLNVYRLFPPMALEMIAVGEETGTLEQMMARLTTFYDEEMIRGLETIGKLVEPVVLCGLGSIVAFLLLAAFQPIYQLAGSF